MSEILTYILGILIIIACFVALPYIAGVIGIVALVYIVVSGFLKDGSKL